jgi:hypothetical protein
MRFLTKNIPMIGIGVVVILAGVYYYMNSGSSAGPALTSSDQNVAVSQDLLIALQNLQTIKLDNSVFSDPVFVSLNDFGVTIPPENVGRSNPFLPLVGVGSTQTGLTIPGAAH